MNHSGRSASGASSIRSNSAYSRTSLKDNNNNVLCAWQNPIQNTMMVLSEAEQYEQVEEMAIALAQVIKVVNQSSDLKITEADLDSLFAALLK